MGAPEGSANAAGNSGGKSLQDRELAAKVRKLALDEIYKVLSQPVVKMKQDDYELYKAILIRLSGTVLPRLNAGRDDDERLIPIDGVNIIVRK